MMPLPAAVRRAYEAGYAEAAAAHRPCTERHERGVAKATALLVARTGDGRWARQRALAYIYPRHAYGRCDPGRPGIDRPANGEQGDEGVQPSAWAIGFFDGDTRYWDELWATYFGAPRATPQPAGLLASARRRD